MKIIILLLMFIFFACKPAENRIKDYSYTNEWYYNKEQRYQVYQTRLGNKYILVLNKKQSKFIRRYLNE